MNNVIHFFLKEVDTQRYAKLYISRALPYLGSYHNTIMINKHSKIERKHSIFTFKSIIFLILYYYYFK